MKKIIFLPVLLTFIVGCSSKDKTYIQRRDDCAELAGQKVSLKDFIKKYKLATKEGFKVENVNHEAQILANFCSFYRLGNNNY